MAPLYEIWLFESKPVPEISLPVTWTLALRTLGTNITNFYTIAGGIHLTDGPYTHRIMQSIPFSPALNQPISPFDKFTPIGTLDEDGFRVFEEVFERTEVGPNQFFVVRVFGEMAIRGLLGWDVVREWRGKARYADREWDTFLEEYTIADRRFLGLLDQIELKE